MCPSLTKCKFLGLFIPSASNNYVCKGLQKCQHYHQEGSNRRPVFGPNEVISYLPAPCQGGLPVKESGITTCAEGDKCLYAHTQNEILYHPLIYRTIKCELKPSCQQDFCPYFHNSLDERNITTLLKNSIPAEPHSPLITAVSASSPN